MTKDELAKVVLDKVRAILDYCRLKHIAFWLRIPYNDHGEKFHTFYSSRVGGGIGPMKLRQPFEHNSKRCQVLRRSPQDGSEKTPYGSFFLHPCTLIAIFNT